MKKMMFTLVAMLTIAVSANAMSYEQARNEALFLTDKMAYELNLSDAQYEAAYEINLDYLMGVTSYNDVFGTYWERRNLDLSYILYSWQWDLFRAATYFYRPLYWADGFWHFAIYGRYPHRDYFYYGRPVFYATYRGAHAWHRVGGHGWYHGHRDHYVHHRNTSHFGMRDSWDRGDYRHHHNNGVRHSSTRTTVNHRDMNRHHENNGNRDYNRNGNNQRNPNVNHGNHENRPNRTVTNGETRTTRSLGGYRSNSSSPRQMERTTAPATRVNTPSHSSSNMRSSSAPVRSTSGGSFSRSSSSPSHSGGSFSRGGGSHSSGSGRSSGGGHSYGGRR